MTNKDTAILLSTFGTSVLRAAEESYCRIAEDLERETGLDVLIVYTDTTAAKAVSTIGGRKVYTVTLGVEESIVRRFTEIIAVPMFFAQGENYRGLKNKLDYFRDTIDIRLANSVLSGEKACSEAAEVIAEILKPDPENEYILLGYEVGAFEDRGYEMLGEALRRNGHRNIHVIRLSERDSVGQAVARLNERQALARDAQAVIVPLSVAWRDYLDEDMYSFDSNYFVRQLRKAGYRTVFTGKGFGEYEAFRKIFVHRFNELVNE